MPEIETALREFVRSRAAGLCEYCCISERFALAEHEVDHVIAVKHGGQAAGDLRESFREAVAEATDAM